jgi:16S rRNA processing protein RimM
MTERRVLVGVVAGAHGVRGAVRIRSFTANPRDIARYGALCDEPGARRFTMRVLSESNGMVVAHLSGVEDRDAAATLRGLRLYVPRKALPDAGREQWYHADLIGLRAELKDGTTVGRVKSVQNFGAGDLLEIEQPDGTTAWLSFTRPTVPKVDIAGGRIVVEPPPEIAGEGSRVAKAK